MKKIFNVLAVAALLLCANGASARNVSLEQAKDVAAHYLAQNSYHRVSPADLTLVHQMYNKELGIPSMYFFNAEDWGWIAIAATTVTDPVVAFSTTNNIDLSNIAPANRWWLESYNDAVAEIQTMDAEKNFPDCDEWRVLENHQLKGDPKGQVIVMQEQWGQGDDNGYSYNMYSPTDPENGIYCPTGCVATAMAQIIHYYRYPVCDTGKVVYAWHGTMSYTFLDTFDYSLMPNKLTNNSTLEQRQEVSKLGYACGMAVKMNYGYDGSGAHSEDVPNAMKKYFKYKVGTLISRSSNDTAFIGKIRRDLMRGPNGKGRPVYMSGKSSTDGGPDAAGHAWVCAGYMTNDTTKYYMNWGWEGTGNTFYNLSGNNMAISQMGYNFKLNQRAIVGMVPPEDSSILSIPRVATATLGSAYPNPAAVSVKLPYSTTMNAEMLIYSVDGKVVARRKVQPGSGTVEVRVDAMPSGIYIYRLGDAYGKFVVK